MEPLPEWIQKGIIIGIENGQDFVDEKYAFMKNLGLPMVGIWMQDWSGMYEYTEGKRVLWNWQLSQKQYYDWDRMVTDWAKDGVRPLIYMNPFIARLTEEQREGLRQDQFAEGEAGGFFIKNAMNETYMIKSVSIDMAIIDLTNPSAWDWTKKIIKENLVGEAKSFGWMHDFGEYMPFDAVVFDGSDPMVAHN